MSLGIQLNNNGVTVLDRECLDTDVIRRTITLTDGVGKIKVPALDLRKNKSAKVDLNLISEALKQAGYSLQPVID